MIRPRDAVPPGRMAPGDGVCHRDLHPSQELPEGPLGAREAAALGEWFSCSRVLGSTYLDPTQQCVVETVPAILTACPRVRMEQIWPRSPA